MEKITERRPLQRNKGFSQGPHPARPCEAMDPGASCRLLLLPALTTRASHWPQPTRNQRSRNSGDAVPGSQFLEAQSGGAGTEILGTETLS